jgi:FAD/FMN-containing dehydrogenase
MKRRDLIKTALVLPAAAMSGWSGVVFGASSERAARRARVRPGDPGWPSAAEWERLSERVGGRLVRPVSPFASCAASASDATCATALKRIGNPYYVGDEVALTQTSGWMGAWQSHPSVYAVAAETTADVVAAVNFARDHNLRLVVKGGGHSYQGTSNAPDSLLVWTRHMNRVTLHDAFVPEGCNGKQAPQPAASIQSGAMWADAYHAVATTGGRYVQGGGCMNVGVAGLVQSGGFGSCSKRFGTAAAGLIEAEVVTADGKVRIVNACQDAELFWALKGGGGGSFGVVTRVTLRTHELPNYFGVVQTAIKAASDEAYRALIARMMSFYATDLLNPHWGEQIAFRPDNVMRLRLMFQGLTAAEASARFAPFFEWVRARPQYSFTEQVLTADMPGRHLWDAEYLRQHAPGAMIDDDRPGAPSHHALWQGDHDQVGWFIHAYKSAWLPASLLEPGRQQQLTDALFEASRQWEVGLHFNKGIAGAAADEVAAVRDTATNPQVVESFALAIIAMGGPPAFTGMPGASVDEARARTFAARIDQSMTALLKAAPGAGSYVSESDYFQPDWQTAFWGTNYPRLAAVKRKYDPRGLFFVHHGVGSEAWSADGFTRL